MLQSTSSASSQPNRRSHLYHRLQWASLALAWNIFVITFSSTLGSSALWISMSVALLTISFEVYLIRRRARDRKEEAERILIAPDTQNTLGLDTGKPPAAGPAPYNDQAQVPAETMSTTAPPSPLPAALPQEDKPEVPVEHRWVSITARLALLVLWLAAFITGIVMAAIVGGHWGQEWSIPARVIEIILMFGMLVLQSLLSVLSIQERERTISGREPSTVWCERRINL